MGKKPFYDNFITLCKKNNKKPTPVAKEIGISPTNIKRWERGATVNSDIIVAMAEYFDVSTDYLLTGEDKRYEETERYIDFLENLLITLSKRHEETSDILREKAKNGETNAYFEIPQIQGTAISMLLYSLSLAENANTTIDTETFEYAKERLMKRCGNQETKPAKEVIDFDIMQPPNKTNKNVKSSIKE